MALRDDICSAMENYALTSTSDWNVIKADDLKKGLDSGKKLFLLDVREPSEFREGHISRAVNISVNELPRRVGELPQEKGLKMVVYCATGRRSAYAAMFLRVYGYGDVRSLAKGYKGWAGAGYPAVR
ncbi:MAG TPA: rhodanese-like domain-containing protein [Methanocella sp.]|uniref:rhodanese-like domain-containing protein n=1 Tax=Methanocella sp. TaxID=2052833 RepID=UPI002BDB96F7|nr:rhodanese-like domain-containing protein [Methanocella sp.]HTY91583.1 rhodanese-like domain-containing protein [Methanocella sp.]